MSSVNFTASYRFDSLLPQKLWPHALPVKTSEKSYSKEKPQYVIGTVGSLKTSDLLKSCTSRGSRSCGAMSEKLKEDDWKYEPIEKLLCM
ncbi:hypothetical protein MRX96_010763 [Rhipicephalus microplus]